MEQTGMVYLMRYYSGLELRESCHITLTNRLRSTMFFGKLARPVLTIVDFNNCVGLFAGMYSKSCFIMPSTRKEDHA